jgi:hypothetical protein
LYPVIAVGMSPAASAVCASSNCTDASFGCALATAWYAITAFEYAWVSWVKASVSDSLWRAESASTSGSPPSAWPTFEDEGGWNVAPGTSFWSASWAACAWRRQRSASWR